MAPAATDQPSPAPLVAKASSVQASVLHGPRDLRLESRSLDSPSAGEVQVAIRATGICGSDVSYYTKFANGDLCACMPLSLGHEAAGVVVAVGPDVAGFAVGDHVALEVGVACDACTICREGRYNLCKQMRFRSSAKSVPHYQGTLQERINHPAKWCHRLPQGLSWDAAALVEPLAVALHAVNRAQPRPGSTAVVIGAGTVGLLTAAVARAAGCVSITMADVDAGRIAFALKKGFADHGYVVPRNAPPPPSSSSSSASSSSGTSTPASMLLDIQLDRAKNIAADLLDLDKSLDDGVDIAFECTGKEECMHACLYSAKPGGKVIMVGMGTPIQTLPLSVAHLREIDILGVFRYANTYAAAIRMLSSGVFSASTDALVTHHFKGLEAVPQAFETARRTSDDDGNLVIKVIVEVTPDDVV